MNNKSFEEGYNEIRGILVRLVNNKKSSKQYKAAFDEAVDLLSLPPISKFPELKSKNKDSWLKAEERKSFANYLNHFL